MMPLIIAIIFLSGALLAYLLLGSSTTLNTPTSQKDRKAHDKEIRALIAQHKQDLATLADLPATEQATRQAELEARLYHELKPFTHSTQQIYGAPTWAYTVIVLAVVSAIGAWYYHGGHFIVQWQKLDHRMDSALMRSQFLDELPEQMPAEILSTYCLALQSRIDRQDLNQLDTLAQCVAAYGNYPVARQIYETIYRKNPDNADHVINFAQMSLFSEQGQALPPSLEKSLQRIWLETPDNYMAGVLLASSYTQSGASEQAAVVWQQLAYTMPEDHPLYELVNATYQRMRHADLTDQSITDNATEIDNELNADHSPTNDSDVNEPIELRIEVSIAQQLLDTLPTQSRLFVLASPDDSRMPIAVKRLSLAPQQTIRLSDQDSMQGQSLADHQRLTISAIISLDGQANGNTAQSLSKRIELDSLSLPLEMSFDFDANNSP